MAMKYEIKGESYGQDDDFEVSEVKIVKETTRARIATWTVGVWLFVVVISVASATVTGDRGELHQILSALTPLVTMAFGIYLGQATSK
jgi:hypothetical protein